MNSLSWGLPVGVDTNLSEPEGRKWLTFGNVVEDHLDCSACGGKTFLDTVPCGGIRRHGMISIF